MSQRSERLRGAARWALSICVAGSALAAGGWRLEILPLVALFAYAAFLLEALSSDLSRSRSEFAGVPTIVLGLLALAGITALQAVPLPSWLLGLLSPKVDELRRFVVGVGGGPLSYEPAASAS